jgi:uncharacterized membrane protein YfcA
LTTLAFTLLVGAGSLFAGLLGALTGLGGGVVVVPLLTLAFGVDIRYAIGASLVSVIATSSGAASAYVRQGLSNLRIGVFLEIATTTGAVTGAHLASKTPTSAIAVLFGVVLIVSAYLSVRNRTSRERPDAPTDTLSLRLRLAGSYVDAGRLRSYQARNVPAGFGLMFVAGALSGLLGIGSGAVKVLAMDEAMGLPFKVSTTTSNFMIGVTAAASVGVYLNRGYIDPIVSLPVVLGVLAGSLAGARLLARADTRRLRLVVALVILAVAVELIAGGLGGKL